MHVHEQNKQQMGLSERSQSQNNLRYHPKSHILTEINNANTAASNLDHKPSCLCSNRAKKGLQFDLKYSKLAAPIQMLANRSKSAAAYGEETSSVLLSDREDCCAGSTSPLKHSQLLNKGQ